MKMKLLSLWLVTSMLFSGLTPTTVVQADEQPDWPTYYAGCDWMPLHAEPNEESDVTWDYLHGYPLWIIGVSGDYWETWDGEHQGFVLRRFLVDNPDIYYLYDGYGNWAYGRYSGVYLNTCYTPDPSENGGASVDCHDMALAPQVGSIVACSPRVLPQYTKIFIPGVGFRTVHDTGVTGMHIDILTWNENDFPKAYRDLYIIE